jgi:hypothetical protein
MLDEFTAQSSWVAFVLLERRRHARRLYMACVVGVLIAVLIYQTQWLNLRTGLMILLVGQVGAAAALILRIAKLSKNINQSYSASWFESEEFFLNALALFDTACQAAGFLTVGWAFWISTQNLGVSVAIGVLYPVIVCLGITRRKNRAIIKQLRSQAAGLPLLKCGP